MTPEEIVSQEVGQAAQPPKLGVEVQENTDCQPIKVRGKTNDELDKWRGPGFGRFVTHRKGGINSQLEDSLFGAIDADKLIKCERAWHRRAVDLSIQGFNITEICNLLGYGRGQVETVLKQPWAQERIIQASKRTVMEEMKEFLEGEVMPSLKLIKQLRDDSTLKAEVRSEAASKLLNRFLGKEVQPMTTIAKDEKQMTTTELAEQAQRILESQRQ